MKNFMSDEPDIFVDPGFATPLRNGFDFPDNFRGSAMAALLACRVERQPNDLRIHVQRICHAAAIGETEEQAQALADLFIVLGAKGVGLRARMLKGYGEKIPPAWKALLYGRFISGLDAYVPLPARSRLTAGTRGRRHFIALKKEDEARIGAEGRDFRPAREIMLDLINSGRLSDACLMLESELKKIDDRQWEENAVELIRLYRYMDDGEARANGCLNTLLRLSPAKAEQWAALRSRNVGS